MEATNERKDISSENRIEGRYGISLVESSNSSAVDVCVSQAIPRAGAELSGLIRIRGPERGRNKMKFAQQTGTVHFRAIS